MEGPAQHPGSHVVRPHVARRRREALRRPTADDEQVLVHDPGCPERYHQLLAGPEPVPHVDTAAVAECRDGASRRGVQRIEELLHRDEDRSEEHTSELQSRLHLVCRLLLEKKKKKNKDTMST